MNMTAERTGALRLPAWMKEGPGLSSDGLIHCAQLTKDDVLLRRRNEDGPSRYFIIYDKTRKLPRHFDPPDDLLDRFKAFVGAE